jgi:hypothetical protein
MINKTFNLPHKYSIPKEDNNNIIVNNLNDNNLNNNNMLSSNSTDHIIISLKQIKDPPPGSQLEKGVSSF